MSDKKLVVCVCGGGNGAHVMAGLAAAQPNTETRVLTMFRNEAERWTEFLKENDGYTVKRNLPDKSVVEIKSKPSIVSKEASEVIPGSNFIVFCVPAFAHEQYFTAIKEFVEPNTAIIGLPGQPGFEFQCFHILGDTARKCSILAYESLPWACRILEFGRLVEVLGAKDSLIGSIVRGQSNLDRDPIESLQSILGDHPVLKKANNFIEPYLTTKSIIHPPIMFSRWKDWDGQPVDEKPLFYQGLDEAGAECLSKVSQEVVDTAKVISEKTGLKLDNVEHLYDWYCKDYRETVSDPTNLFTCMKTNAAYNGLVHPMKQTEDGKFLPDYRYRYLMEDIPFGLVVTKGLGLLAGVPTPETDRVLTWCQKQIGKQFIVGTELKGRDVPSSRAPQAYGFNSLDDLMKLM